jgi:hypothetical protein
VDTLHSNKEQIENNINKLRNNLINCHKPVKGQAAGAPGGQNIMEFPDEGDSE